MNEVVREFLLETHENLAQLDLDLVTLEKDPAERDTLARVFRTLHTIKGTAGFLGLVKLQTVTHAGENLLGRLRAGELVFNPPIASALLAVGDAVRRMLTAVEASDGASDGDGDFADLIQTLERLRDGAPPAAAPPAASPAEPTEVGLKPASPPPPPAAPLLPASPVSVVAEPPAPAVADSAVRVDVGLLDKLMTLVGELVLARNQILQCGATREDAGLQGPVQRINALTTELQANVMKTRMQPLSTVWGKFPRVVRDLAAACGKQVRLEMEGQDTELDRTLVEAVRDPLTHLVRNAVDHGIEPPGERLARGKAAEGRLVLHAAHEGGKVVIEMSDDGGGIDPQRVRARAVQSQLLTADQAARLSDHEAINLVFLPGFSTAERVTQVSGRGVGMDVVRTNVEKIGGTIDLVSRPGQGTTVKLQIPLTLTIIPALIVTSGGDRYAIPQASLQELVRLEGDAARRGVESIHGAPVYRLRGKLLPLVYLDRLLQVEAAPSADEVNIVVLLADGRPFGLVVDGIHDTEEIVVKPLQKQLKGLAVFAGATVRGDGRVALILDVLGLAQRAQVASGSRDRSLVDRPPSLPGPSAERQKILLVAAGGERMAIPLALVDRLEEFPRSSLERVGPRAVVQYRGEILPLLAVGRAGRRRPAPRPATKSGADPLQVVVCAAGGRRVGLVVGRILDVVDEAITARSPAGRPLVLFTAIVQGRVTEFLDVEGLVRAADPEFSPGGQDEGARIGPPGAGVREQAAAEA